MEIFLELQEQWRRVVPRAAATGGAWEKARHLVDPTGFLLLFPSAPAVRNKVTCKAKKMQQPVDFSSVLDLLLFYFFLSVAPFFFSSGRSAVEWLFGRRLLCSLPCLGRCGRR